MEVNSNELFRIIGEQTVELKLLKAQLRVLVSEMNRLREDNAHLSQQISRDYGELT